MTLQLRSTVRMKAYLDALVEMEGFGRNREQVAERLVWKCINDLIASGRLRERDMCGVETSHDR